MAVKLRMTRHGAKKRPFYWIVAADGRNARDGRYLEKVGTYNPMLPKDDEKRVVLDKERVKYWLDNGAQPSERVAIFIGKAGITDMPAQSNNPQKAQPKAAAVERAKEREEKAAAKAEAEAQAKADAEAAANAPAEEEAPAADEAPAEEATAEAPAEEAPAEEAPASEDETKTDA